MKLSEYIKAEKRRTEEQSKYKVACKHCGHVVILVKENKTICDYCGYYIFKTPKAEFEYRIKEMMKKSR